MIEKVPLLSQRETERFKIACAEIATMLWNGCEDDEVHAHASTLFPNAAPDYVPSLLGKTPESRFRFVRTWLQKEVEKELTEGTIGEADALAYFEHRRDRMRDKRKLEQQSPSK